MPATATIWSSAGWGSSAFSASHLMAPSASWESSALSRGAMPIKISVKDLAKRFVTDQGSLQVVNGVSFDVADGEFVAIVGPSGCGKSTLMSIIAGFDRPDRR